MENFSKEYYKIVANSTRRPRIAAALIDYIMVFLIFIANTTIFGDKVEGGYRLEGSLNLIPFLFWILNFIIIEYKFHGSIGNLIMGLKIVSLENEELKLKSVIKRRFCDILDFLWCFGLLGILLIYNTQYSQRLGDILANTVVIKR